MACVLAWTHVETEGSASSYKSSEERERRMMVMGKLRKLKDF